MTSIRRFKESRRRHPLSDRRQLTEAIQLERKMLEELRGKANLVIDTSGLSPRLLKDKLQSLYSESGTGKFTININSFGYKWGIPLDSDIVMDVRFLTNPFYDPHMRMLTGQDRDVIEFVLESPVTNSFNRRFLNLLKYLIPIIYRRQNHLAVSIGCTGRQHRSKYYYYVAGQLKMGYNVLTGIEMLQI